MRRAVVRLVVVALAVVSAVSIAVGAGLWFFPAGLIVGGLLGLGGAYIVAYLGRDS